MLYHRVAVLAGKAQRAGKLFYGYKAACGAPIVSACELEIGSHVAVGPEPHTWCATCHKQVQEEHYEVKLPDDPLGAPVYDEHGKLLRAVREREEGLSAPVNTHEVGLGNSNGLGAYINRPYG